MEVRSYQTSVEQNELQRRCRGMIETEAADGIRRGGTETTEEEGGRELAGRGRRESACLTLDLERSALDRNQMPSTNGIQSRRRV